jgi:hypothetical protein
MGTGITPEEMSELTGEFKKLVKVLSANGKLTQNGDYFLLDVPTKYNEKYNQFEMPLPAEVAESEMTEGEQKLRSLIRDVINEELNSSEYKNMLIDMEKPHYGDSEALDQIIKIYSSHIQSLNSIKKGNK